MVVIVHVGEGGEQVEAAQGIEVRRLGVGLGLGLGLGLGSGLGLGLGSKLRIEVRRLGGKGGGH